MAPDAMGPATLPIRAKLVDKPTTIVRLSAGTAEGKLAQYLLSAVGDEEQVAISATQLSARIGVGRATLYRAFEALEREGAIAREGKVIRILRRELLHHASHKMEHPHH